MALIVVGLLAAFSAVPALAVPRQDAPAADQGGHSGPLGFDLRLDGWTLQDVLEKMNQNRLAVLGAATFLVILFLWVADVLRPGGLGKNGRDVKSHPAMVWLFAGLMVLAAQVFSVAILRDQAWLVGPDPASLRGQSALGGAVYIVSAAVALGMVYLFARSAPKAGLVPGLLDVPIGLLCLALAAPVVVLSSEVAVMVYQQMTGATADLIAHPQLALIVDHRSDPWVWGLIAAAVAGAPIVEEVTYRVFFQSAILKWSGSHWIAVIGSAGIFTAMHAIGPHPLPPYALATIATLGLALGVAYEKTRRIGVPIVMHMGFNAANVLLALQAQG